MHLLEPSHSNANDCDFGATIALASQAIGLLSHKYDGCGLRILGTVDTIHWFIPSGLPIDERWINPLSKDRPAAVAVCGRH
ncbi:hypothetical protein EMIHUDRAFT_200910 [Emiliania huxleyi CCMP1516]|uniref:Uncharacterized protein n=2 Tax=Emiliania huxleyi TaxID=2903 RepID=A0A0D3KLU5_EMIH1|nr:hypothetical protein EMIHUDRAFT_200910 [Emiliania huxleyi CCMP1516]EOD36730.1 hypothetical protein EMIHUDRAFT_200910 [Emiliania huxleyi CCMP1516]|eukprot:XP_005789159.1 hypothetical protein EMIHUDRAFT_200910 [Emiliania huxleyi CCMP1516]